MSQRDTKAGLMQGVQDFKLGMQELDVDDVEQVSGGIILILMVAAWAAAHNGDAYSADVGAGAWG